MEAPEATTIPAQASLHFREGVQDDEPFEFDIVVTVECPCGRKEVKRDQVYKPHDVVHVFCYGCGAEYHVAVSTSVELLVKAEKVGDAYPASKQRFRTLRAGKQHA